MSNRFSLLTLLMLCLFSACVIDTDDQVAPTPEPEREPTSLRTGLLFHVPFSGNADDVAVNALSGSVTGATITDDRNGSPAGAYRFDGEDDFINFGNQPGLAFPGRDQYTIAAWVKPERRADDSRMHVISKFDGGVRAAWYLGVGQNATVDSYRNLAPWATLGVGSFGFDGFVHIATAYDGTDLTVYVNGVEDNRTPFAGNPNDAVTDILVGGVHSEGEVRSTFNGVIDDIRIYNRVLTAEELTWLAEN